MAYQQQWSLTLSRPLTKLFSTSYHTGIYPSCCKAANVQATLNNPEINSQLQYALRFQKWWRSWPTTSCSLPKIQLPSYGSTVWLSKCRSTGDLIAFLSKRWSISHSKIWREQSCCYRNVQEDEIFLLNSADKKGSVSFSSLFLVFRNNFLDLTPKFTFIP